MIGRKLFTLLFFLVIPLQVFSQTATSNILGFTAYPTTVSSLGMGNNSVAFTNADDALTFNPANLVFSKGVGLSYFRNPFYVGSHQYPFTNLNLSFTLPTIGAFSFEYRNQSFPEVHTTTLENPDGYETIEPYNRSFTIGYARYLTRELSIGASIRYAGEYNGSVELDGFLFSLGTNYNPKILESRLSVGFSIMNLGSSLEYEFNVATDIYGNPAPYQTATFNFSPPGYINLGADFKFAKNKYYNSSLQLAFSKPIIDSDDDGNGKSSFKSLFSDWDDFPRDVNLHTGIAFEWEPISLGNNFTFFQEMYLGNYSEGVVNGNSNLLTHGLNIGVGYKNVQLKIGYSGTWYNANSNSSNYYYLPSVYPKESWQFSLNWKTPEFLGYSKSTEKKNKMKKINLLTGAGYSMKVGDYSEPTEYSTNENNLSYYLEADFYFNDNTALVSNFTYSSYNNKGGYGYYNYITELESVSLSSSLRYHPLRVFLPFFIQTGLGIYHLNPIQTSTPKYSYKTFLTNRIGVSYCVNYFVIQPEIDWILLFDKKDGGSNLLYGLSQFDISLKLGYSL